MEVENFKKIFVLHFGVLRKTNHSAVFKIYDKALFILWL